MIRILKLSTPVNNPQKLHRELEKFYGHGETLLIGGTLKGNETPANMMALINYADADVVLVDEHFPGEILQDIRPQCQRMRVDLILVCTSELGDFSCLAKEVA